jgi:hypothetical protein
MNTKQVQETAKVLKDLLLRLAVVSDAAKGGYEQNKEVLEKAIIGEANVYHLNTVQIGFLRALDDCQDLQHDEFQSVLRALSDFDSALKESSPKKSK